MTLKKKSRAAASPTASTSGREPDAERFRRAALLKNLAASSSGSDKKRSHFPLKINKTAAQSEHAQKSSQRTDGSLLQLFKIEPNSHQHG